MSAVDFFALKSLRDPSGPAAKLAEQFVERNQGLLDVLEARIDREYDGREVRLILRAGGVAGAIPLFSPTSARPDYGLVVRPRFSWMGIGPMLARMGWKVTPSPLKLPMLRRSERRVPLWVLSSMILTRLNLLLDTIERRFEVVHEDVQAPRGRVDWATYATNRLPQGKALQLPCAFPDLRDDRLLRGAVRYCVERQLQALETQRGYGAFVQQLIEFGMQVLARVRQVASVAPSRGTMEGWLQRPLRHEHFVEGIQGMRWTMDERGLAGMSDMEGIPWRLPMDAFFEAWVETVLGFVCRSTGGRLKTGRQRETVHAIEWSPAFQGSQKSLVPDFWVDYPGMQVIVDAKYKRHWEEFQERSWMQVEQELREAHRNDLLQVLAYGSLAESSRVVVCLVYPCAESTWLSLKERGRLHHQAEIVVGQRRVKLWLTAVPMALAPEVAGMALAEEIQKLLGQD